MVFDFKKNLLFVLFIFLFFSFSDFVLAFSEIKFYIDPAYDSFSRDQIIGILIKTTNSFYIYAEKTWWDGLGSEEKKEIDEKIYLLSLEFERNIYPKLTATFGFEPKPGIDKDDRITLLIHQMPGNIGGYTRTADVYERVLSPKSNQKEMIYLNSKYSGTPLGKVFLAHEFLHLITINQKNLLRNIEEETWLNELRAEYISTFLGYNDNPETNQLEERIKSFIKKPNDSLIDWKGDSSDYGIVSLFGHYLVDHYGIEILVDSLQSEKVGIESINYALKKRNFQTEFNQIFTDFSIAVFLNDCSYGEKYCFKNKNLQKLKISPTIYYLPGTESLLSTFHQMSDWSVLWQKIIAAGKYFTLEFEGQKEGRFNVVYFLCDLKDKCEINFLKLDQEQKGKIEIANFKEKYYSLILILTSQFQTSNFEDSVSQISLYWKASSREKEQDISINQVPQSQPSSQQTIQSLLIQILQEISKRITQPQGPLQNIKPLLPQEQISCKKIEKDLYFGLKNDSEVRCLQEFLKSHGPEIYPEGLVTGNFLHLTKSAVIRFQEKYRLEILTPLGLEKGTGFVGALTRAKINQLLKSM